MNALLPLRVQVVHHDGKPLLNVKQDETDERVLKVNLVSAVTLPSQKDCVVQAEVLATNVDSNVDGMLFEPNHEALNSLGLELMESLVTVNDGKVLLPVENPQGISIRLDVCFELGTVRSIDSLSREPCTVTDSCEASRNADVKAITPTPERASKLVCKDCYL